MKLNWREELKPQLTAARRVAILGIGSPLNSDDAAGMLLIEELKRRNLDEKRALLIFGSSAPENFTGVIREFSPDLLLAADAAHLGLAPGAVALVTGDELDGLGFSTHMLPFSVMLQYLARDGLQQALLLGIEPAGTDFGFTVSAPVRQAVLAVADFLAEVLTS